MIEHAIKRLPLSSLRPADYNPRRMEGRAFAGLVKSLDTYGCVEPLVWNQRTGTLVAGHQRLRALEELGATEADVVVVDLDEVHERALNVTLNNPHIQGEFTADAVDLLRELAGAVAEFEPMGLQDLLKQLESQERAFAQPAEPSDMKPLDAPDAPIVCPNCGHEFTRADAKA